MITELTGDRKNCLEDNKRVVLETRINQFRHRRNSILTSSDIDFIRLLEEYLLSQPNLPQNLKSIIDKRNELRDVTNLNIDQFSDEIEIMNYNPSCLD